MSSPYVEVGAWSGRTYPRGAVVVGYNGRTHSRIAVTWAAREASRRGLPLVVVHAANYPGMTGPPGRGLHHRDPGALEAAEEVTARGVAEALAVRPDLEVVGATEVTTAVRALTEASRDAALVVVGSRGLGRILTTLLGSVSSSITARATAPVAVVTQDVPTVRSRNRYATRSVVLSGGGPSKGLPDTRRSDGNGRLQRAGCSHSGRGVDGLRMVPLTRDPEKARRQ